MERPNLFIVGQPKSGTTALHYFLHQHPDVYMCREKEPLFFCKDFHEEGYAFHGRNRYFRFIKEEDYLSLFYNNKSAGTVGECSTHYLYSKVAANEIYKFNRDAKIIIMLRNPVDFIYSYHSHVFIKTYEDVEDFEKALYLEDERRQGKKIPPRVYIPSFLYYSERIKYAEHVKRFYDLFDKSNIRVIIYEDFKENNLKVYKDTLEFLRIDVDFVPDFRMVNVNRKPRNKKLNYFAHNFLLKQLVRKVLTSRNYYIFKDIIKRIILKEEQRPQMNPLLREELMKKYGPEMLKIGDLLNIDLEKKWYCKDKS